MLDEKEDDDGIVDAQGKKIGQLSIIIKFVEKIRKSEVYKGSCLKKKCSEAA